MVESLSPKQARKLVLASQGVYRESDCGRGAIGVVNVAEALSYIQIDTISVVARAHHHTLWTRVNNYQAKHLDQAVAERKVFEYWSHAAAFLPMCDFRYSLQRKNAIASGEKHWYEKDPKQMAYVLDQIAEKGPMQAKDFEQSRSIKREGWGDQKPAKRALEQLFMQGDLMISRRQGFQKVFDLTERVLPKDTDVSTPSFVEFLDHLIYRYLRANGFASARQIAYLRKGLSLEVERRCQQLLEDRKLVVLRVSKNDYYALTGFGDTLSKKISRRRLKILSPFDNLLIQRQRMRDLFGFDYQIECYVPAAKRKHGYFVLPILWGQAFAGRLDAKVDRKKGVLHVLNLYLETAREDEFMAAIKTQLQCFAEFNGAREYVLHNVHRR